MRVTDEAVQAAMVARADLLSDRPDPTALSDETLTRLILEAAAPFLAGGFREHLDADHAVMVQLGRIAECAVQMLEHVSMDTAEDRELHARAVSTLRGRLGEIAAGIKEANESVAKPVCPKCGTAACLEDKALDW